MPPTALPCHDLRRWNALARHTFGDIDVQAAPEHFSAVMATREVAALRLVDVQSSAARVRGGAARRAGWYLLFNRGGACTLRQRGRSGCIDEGELSLLHADEPFEIQFTQPNRMHVLGLPALGAPGLLGERVARRHAREDASVIGTLLQRLQQLGTEAAQQMDAAALRRALFDLLLLARPQDGPATPALTRSRRQLMLERLQWHVAQQFEDPELDAAQLGRALGVSARHVQALLAGQGTTLGAQLLELRLQRAAQRLREPGAAREPITVIALQSGFGDVSHFCRSFRRRFGCSASTWRAGG